MPSKDYYARTLYAQSLFKKYTRHDADALTADDFCTLLEEAGIVNEEEQTALFAFAVTHGWSYESLDTTRLSFDEFEIFYNSNNSPSEKKYKFETYFLKGDDSQKNLKYLIYYFKQFQRFDTTKTGVITFKQFEHFYKSQPGESFSDKQIDSYFTFFHPNYKGKNSSSSTRTSNSNIYITFRTFFIKYMNAMSIYNKQLKLQSIKMNNKNMNIYGTSGGGYSPCNYNYNTMITPRKIGRIANRFNYNINDDDVDDDDDDDDDELENENMEMEIKIGKGIDDNKSQSQSDDEMCDREKTRVEEQVGLLNQGDIMSSIANKKYAYDSNNDSGGLIQLSLDWIYGFFCCGKHNHAKPQECLDFELETRVGHRLV